jgi:hypothetical protein
MPPHVPPVPAPTPEPVLQLPVVDAAALLAHLQQLTATVQAMQHQNVMLQDQLDVQAAAAAPPVPPMLIPAPEIKIAVLDVNNGALDRVAMVWLKIKEVKQGQESVDNYVI